MAPMAEYLEEHGFRTENIGYASTEQPIRELTEILHEELQGCCLAAGRRLNFVTHSLGGILLSPPNKGSELADAVRETWLADVIPVPALDELGTNPDSVPNLLGPVSFELGVITGDESWHPLGAIAMEGENDGVVSVESARVEGMKAFLVTPTSHTFIMKDPDVAKQVVHFLRTGEFLGNGRPIE